MNLKSNLIFNLMDILDLDLHEFDAAERADWLITEHVRDYQSDYRAQHFDNHHQSDLVHDSYDAIIKAFDAYKNTSDNGLQLQDAVDFVDRLRRAVNRYNNACICEDY